MAAALGDAFGVMCPARTRSFDRALHDLRNALFGDTATKTAQDKSPGAFAVIDGVRGQGALAELKTRHVPIWPLYADAEADLLNVSPCLVALADSAVLDAVFPLLWGEARGLFLTAPAPTDRVLDLMQTLAVAEMPDGDLALLRFFDPRVLPRLMDALDHDQRQQFFSGVVAAYHLEDARGRLISFTPELRDETP